MDVHELIRVFLKEENRKELSLYAYMLMGNKNDALDLLSDLLIEIYENPKMQDAIDPSLTSKPCCTIGHATLRKGTAG